MVMFIIGPSKLNQVTVAAIASLIMCVLSSVVFFVFGYICAYNHKQHRTPNVIEATQPVQVYEEVDQLSTMPARDQNIELNENVAYGSVHP